MIIFRKS